MFISLDYYLQNNRRKGAKNPCGGQFHFHAPTTCHTRPHLGTANYWRQRGRLYIIEQLFFWQ